MGWRVGGGGGWGIVCLTESIGNVAFRFKTKTQPIKENGERRTGSGQNLHNNYVMVPVMIDESYQQSQQILTAGMGHDNCTFHQSTL